MVFMENWTVKQDQRLYISKVFWLNFAFVMILLIEKSSYIAANCLIFSQFNYNYVEVLIFILISY